MEVILGYQEILKIVKEEILVGEKNVSTTTNKDYKGMHFLH